MCGAECLKRYLFIISTPTALSLIIQIKLHLKIGISVTMQMSGMHDIEHSEY